MRLWRADRLAMWALPLILMAGCTGSDVISTGNTPFVVEVPIVNPDDRFDLLAQR